MAEQSRLTEPVDAYDRLATRLSDSRVLQELADSEDDEATGAEALAELVQDPRVRQAHEEPVVCIDGLAQARALGHQPLCRLRIVPELGGRRKLVKLLQARAFGLDVKGNP
jgi:hypothetical protein